MYVQAILLYLLPIVLGNQTICKFILFYCLKMASQLIWTILLWVLREDLYFQFW